jgi:AraC-like DNA-binding protein
VPCPTSAEKPVALRVERGPELDARRRLESDPALLFPLEESVVSLEIAAAPPGRVDRSSFALVPAGAPHLVRTESPIAALVTLVLRARARGRAAREYGSLDSAEFASLIARPRVLPRTRWVDELAHRYLFERDVCEKHRSAACVFLETEIVKELYFLCKEQDENRTRASVVHEEGSLAQRARAWIDAHLFSPLRVGELARECATSESTLLRTFQRELGRTPASYARERRLDAALLLLKSGRYGVGEIAARVGYSSLAAFSEAFHKRFGAPPSHVKWADRTSEVLPPHGKPPRRKRRRL